jgi:nitronate monooxygenase
VRKDAARIRALTDRPFGIDLFIDPKACADRGRCAARRARAFADVLRRAGTRTTVRAAVSSFTFGIPQPEILSAARQSGIYTIGTATTADEAIALESAGVDAVCARGAEAGGHRGTFLSDPFRALIGTLALVPQMVDAVKVPAIASGGIADGRGVAAVVALGAIAAQCGTAFLRAQEAATSMPYRAALEIGDDEMMLTTAFSGRLARGIRNRFSTEMDDPQKRAPYPYQNALTRDLRTKAAQAGNAEFLSLWAGQAFRLAQAGTTAEIVRRTLDDAVKAFRAAVEALNE